MVAVATLYNRYVAVNWRVQRHRCCNDSRPGLAPSSPLRLRAKATTSQAALRDTARLELRGRVFDIVRAGGWA
jgi:hypothetical protein